LRLAVDSSSAPALLPPLLPPLSGSACRSSRRALLRRRALLGAGMAARFVLVRRAQVQTRIQAIRLRHPQAPKGGNARLIAIGTFDNFNMAVAGVRGSIVAASISFPTR